MVSKISIVETETEAEHFYRCLPRHLQFAHFSPAYVLADALREENVRPRFFVYEDSGGLFYHAFHMREAPFGNFHDIESPYGYGGPLIHAEDPDFASRAFAAYREWCRDNRILVEFIRFHPHLKAWEYYDGESFFNRNTVWVDCSADNFYEGYNATTRTELRKLEKSSIKILKPEPEQFCRMFKPVYYETMKYVGALGYYFFNDAYFEAISNLPGIFLILQDENNNILGGTIGFASGEDVEYHLAATTSLGKMRHAGLLLVHELRKAARVAKASYLNLGGGTNSASDNPLLGYKKHFSKKIEEFHIGKHILFPKEYAGFKRKWSQETGNDNNLAIFYRQPA